MANFKSKVFFFTVFTTNFCLMVLEIVASRMIAPFVGSSLYTWTSMIGIVLLGVSFGNLYGGKISDKHASHKLVAGLLWIAGIATLSTPLFVNTIGTIVANKQNHYLFQTFATSFIYFFPSFVIGTISPIIAKLALTSLKNSGNIVGNLYAAGAIGSIVGTYLAGFILITYFGLQMIIVAIAVIFFASGYLFAKPFELNLIKKSRWLIFPTVLFLIISALNPAYACQANSNYYCIFIYKDKNNADMRYLKMDQLLHSATDLKNPLHLEFGYVKFIGLFSQYIKRDNLSALFLGGGGYTLPRYFINAFNASSVDVVEIDPEVTKIAYSFFDVPKSDRLKTFNMDARVYLSQINPDQKYDIIVGDAFSDASVASHLTTKEFNQTLKNRLKAEGFYIINVIDTLSPGLFINSYLYTVSTEFKYVYLYKSLDDLKDPRDRQNVLVVAGENPINQAKLEEVALSQGYSKEEITLIYDSQAKSNKFTISNPILITDNHAPTDILLNPL